jgi:pimeloyl-ACP methyl ester carboxylesterase
MDLPGHGGAPAGPGHADTVTMASLAQNTLDLIDTLGTGRCVVAGHSLGALVALACASRPDLVAASVLLDPAPIASRGDKDFFARSTAEVAVDVDGSWRRRFVERLIPRTDVPGRAELIDAFARFPVDLAAAECRAMAEADGQAALAAVRVPVLMITAGAPEAEALEQLPAVVLGRTVGSAHFVQLEVPDQVAAMIERFLEVELQP